MALSFALPIRRRRTTVARSQAVAEVEVTEPVEAPEPAVVPVVSNPFAGLEAALTTGHARLQLMRNLRG